MVEADEASLWLAEPCWQVGALECLLLGWGPACGTILSVYSTGKARAFWIGSTFEVILPPVVYLAAFIGFDSPVFEDFRPSLGYFRAFLANLAAVFALRVLSVEMRMRRYLGAAKRDVRLERSLFGGRDGGCDSQLAADAETPSRQLAAAELTDALTAALSRLPLHYRQVIEWRNCERKPFEQIGAMLDRSPEAARKLWVRAIEQLRVELGITHVSQTAT